MLGPTHRLFAATAYASYATWAGQPREQIILGSIVATATAAAWLSPDMDQTRPFVLLGKALGPAGRLVAHRVGITHCWAMPALLWFWWPPSASPASRWAAAALILGWASHIVGDAIFGKVPLLWPGGPMVGLSLKTGGLIESGRGRWPSPLHTVLVACLAWLTWTMVTA